MHKLKLDPEQLTVESFMTASSPEGTGTVRGAQEVAQPGEEVAEPTIVDEGILSLWTCRTACGQATCGITCQRTCATCDEPTCNSCHVTLCWTGNSPECCA